MANASILSSLAILKQYWHNDLYNMLYRESAGLGLFEKYEQMTANIDHQAVTYGANQSFAKTYTKAKSRRSAAKTADFQVTSKTFYASLGLDGKLLREAQYGKDRGVIVQPLIRESELTMNQFKRNLGILFHGNGGGAIGKILSFAASTITLSAYSDVKNFQVGQFIELSLTDGTSGAVKVGALEIAQVINDPITPQLVFTTTVAAGIPTAAANDFIFLEDTFGATMEGLDAWNPLWTNLSLPGTKFNVNRNLHPLFLAGISEDCSALSVHDTITKLAGKIDNNGHMANTALLSPANYEVLANELRDKTVIQVPAMAGGSYKTNVQYDAIQIAAGRGTISVIADNCMPDNVVRVFDKSKGKIASIGPMVHWDSDNGPSDMRTEDTDDAREIRLITDSNFICTAPGAFARGTVVAPV